MLNTSRKSNSKKLNVAIFFSGRITAYEHITSLDALYKRYNCTLFCSLNKTGTNSYLNTFFKKYNMGQDQINFEKLSYPDWLFYIKKHPWSVYENIYSCLYHNKQAFNLIEEYTNTHRVNFDVVIYYRSDIHTSNKLSLKRPSKLSVYIPEGYNGGHPQGFLEDIGMTDKEYGICSTMAYGSFYSMKVYCGIFDRLFDICINHNTDIHHERLIKRGLELNGIKIHLFKYDYDLHPNRHNIEYDLN